MPEYDIWNLSRIALGVMAITGGCAIIAAIIWDKWKGK